MALPAIDPQKRQQLLLGTILVLGLAYLFHSYLYSPKREELSGLETRLAGLETQNRAARAVAQTSGTAEVERKLALYRDQLQAVEALIPSSEELPDLLDAISAEAQRTGVEVTLIQPTGATEEAYYTRRVYDVAVLGAYHSVGDFLTRVASLPRIVTPLDLSLVARPTESPDQAPKVEARFSIETYVISPTENAAHVEQSE
ncbi:MAG TPA: type 4a pilus biogenesis protein PilO [Longimicrobiaceae bacterium]|nr:type 4a pilus biogenesis protein PilO [Longimicrobiaceae bacterium]